MSPRKLPPVRQIGVTDTVVTKETVDVLKTKRPISAGAHHQIDRAIDWAIATARDLGLTEHVVGFELARQWLRRKYKSEGNRGRRTPRRPITAAMELEVKRRAQAGEGQRAIADAMGIPRSNVQRLLDKKS